MLGWSINLFRIGGIQLAVHFSFLLLLAVNAFDGYADAGWPGLWWSTAVLAAFFGCVVLHELGHCLTAIRFGVNVPRILLLPIGGMAEFDGIPREPRREVLITVAGPAVNFVIAGLLWLALPPAGAAESSGEIPTLTESLHLLLRWNLAMGLFNLLPAFPMDGGRLLRATLAVRLPYLRATFWAATCGKVVCVAGAAVALWLGEPLLIVLFAFIFFVGEMEYRAARRRELDDAHWRAVIARQLAAAGDGDDAGRVSPQS
ncbi:MAG: site-2 protease family protein [Opitutaceae bacterium]